MASLDHILKKFQGMCFEYKESVTWTGAMVPVLQRGGSGLETVEGRCHLARVLIFSQLSTGKGVQPSVLDPAAGAVARSIFGTKFIGRPGAQEGGGFVVSRNKLCLAGYWAHIHPLQHSD